MNLNEWNWNNQKCETCGWSGLGNVFRVREYFDDGVEFECPHCNNYILFVDYPLATPLEEKSSIEITRKDQENSGQNSNSNIEHPRLTKLKEDVYSLPVDSEYKRALLEAIISYGDEIINRPKNSSDKGYDDLEALQQVTLGNRMEQLLATSIGNADSDATNCPFCQRIQCEHLIADLAITEGQIRNGLIVSYLSSNQDLDILELKEKLEAVDEVDFYDYEVDEGSGTWEYAKFWSRTPKLTLDSLFKKVEITDQQVSISDNTNTLVSYGTDFDFYVGHKNWNELSLEQRKNIVMHEFGDKSIEIESYVISTGLKKLQFNGFRSLYVASLMLNERMELIKPNVKGLLDKKHILDILKNSKLWGELTDLLESNNNEIKDYDGVELEALAFTNNAPSILDNTLEMPISKAIEFIRGSLEAFPKSQQELNQYQDESNQSQSDQIILSSTGKDNIPFNIFDFFRCSEVKWIRKEVYYFFSRNKYTLPADVLRLCLKDSNNADRAKYSVHVEHMNPQHIALIIIRNHAFNQLAYGDMYVHRGVLTFVGNEYKKLFITAVGNMESLGFVSKEDTNQDIAELRHLIKNCG